MSIHYEIEILSKFEDNISGQFYKLPEGGSLVLRCIAGERTPFAFFPANGESEIVAGRKMHHTRRAEFLVKMLEALVDAQDLT